MSDLPMAQEDHPAHNIPDATESYSGDESPGGSILDAASSHHQDGKPSNKYPTNNMISTMGSRSVLGKAASANRSQGGAGDFSSGY